MNNEHLEEILKVCEDKDLVVGKVLGLYEFKTKQYTFRDYFNGKSVNYMRPTEQYNRSYKTIMNFIKKEKGEEYELLKIKQ